MAGAGEAEDGDPWLVYLARVRAAQDTLNAAVAGPRAVLAEARARCRVATAGALAGFEVERKAAWDAYRARVAAGGGVLAEQEAG